tara:strand:+ start:1636 stop:1896 length:261 start_codon:yes stop_codon:yes gene_type:complete
MKKFNQFAEDVDKVAALRDRQKAAVAKFKQDSEPREVKKPERKVHSGDIATKDLIQRKSEQKQAAAKAAARKAEIRAEIQNEKDDK